MLGVFAWANETVWRNVSPSPLFVSDLFKRGFHILPLTNKHLTAVLRSFLTVYQVSLTDGAAVQKHLLKNFSHLSTSDKSVELQFPITLPAFTPGHIFVL